MHFPSAFSESWFQMVYLANEGIDCRKSHITFGACIKKGRLKHSQVGVCQRVFNVNLHTEATVRADIGQRNQVRRAYKEISMKSVDRKS